jgi:hypothetical protein
MRVGFTGTSRGMTEAQRLAVAAVLRGLTGVEAGHHGDCVGADAEFHALCAELHITVVIHPPADPKKRAWCQGSRLEPEKPHPDRNHDIVNATDILVAAPAEPAGERLRSGTWATVRYARKRGRPIVIVRPDGTRQGEDAKPV